MELAIELLEIRLLVDVDLHLIFAAELERRRRRQRQEAAVVEEEEEEVFDFLFLVEKLGKTLEKHL